jgi:hypothetical protein
VKEEAMKKLNTLSRLLITTMMLGVLVQVASFSYRLSAGADEAAAANPSELVLPESYKETTRFALLHAILETYGITLADRTAQWALDEVSSLKGGLDQIADRLSKLTGRDGQRMMRRLFAGAAFYRDRSWHGNIAYTIGGTVSFYDVWARYDEIGRTFYLAHELGHVLDAQDSPLHLLLGEVSQTFARDVAAYYDDQGGYHLGRTYPLHDPRDRPRHRSDSAAEDWAESFATVVVPTFEAGLRNIGDARQREVQRFMTLWAAHTFGEYQLQRRR